MNAEYQMMIDNMIAIAQEEQQMSGKEARELAHFLMANYHVSWSNMKSLIKEALNGRTR